MKSATPTTLGLVGRVGSRQSGGMFPPACDLGLSVGPARRMSVSLDATRSLTVTRDLSSPGFPIVLWKDSAYGRNSNNYYLRWR